MDRKITATAALSSTTPSMLAQVLEKIRIQEANILRCSGEEIRRIVTMLRNPSLVLKKFAVFAHLRFTIPGASHAKHHASLMHNAGDMGNLRSAAAAMRISSKATFLAKIVLSFVRGVAARGLFSRVYTSDQDMNPRVRQRVDEYGTDMDRRVRQRIDEDVAPKVQESVDWTSMTYDPMLHIFTLLDSLDRASLASTCKPWRSLGASPYPWSSLDLRANKFDLPVAASLENRCTDLQKVRFNGLDSAAALVSLKAKNLREISGERCDNVTDATLSMIVARHEALESLQLGPGFGERITSEAIKIIAICCTKLKTLRLSGMRDLSDVGFFDCLNINEEALGQVVSLRYLSVTGTANINWRVAAESWEKLPNLTALDVSSTSIDHVAVSRLFKSSQSLEVVCALNCPMLEEHDGEDLNPDRFKGLLLIAMFNNTLNGMASIFEDDNSKMPKDTMRWLEWNLSRTLLFLAENNLLEVNGFWQSHGANLFLRLMQSSQEDVQERATKGLAAFIYVGDDYEACVYHERAEAVMHDGGTPILLKLAKSWKESFQAEAASAVANLLSIATNEFTIPGASHAKHHASLMHNAGDMGNLRSAAAAMRISSKATFLAKIVIRNLENYQPECSKENKESSHKSNWSL
ncbi:hypothetical protein Bca4012_021851 [Brassica carinata]